MKTLVEHINESLKIGKDLSDWTTYTYQPKTRGELKDIIRNRISKSYTDSKYEEYKYCGKILLNTLFDINKRNFIENIKIKPKNNSYLFKDSNGDIELYGERFRKKI